MRRAPSQDSFGLAALRSACLDSGENGAAAEPASCATGVRHARSEPLLRGAASEAAARLNSPASTAGHMRKAAAAQRKPLTQLHLDLGQVTQHAPVHSWPPVRVRARCAGSRQSLACKGQLGSQSWEQ